MTAFRIFLRFIFIFEVFRYKIFNIFFLFFFFKSKVLYLLSQVKITLNIYIFMLLKDIFVVLQLFIFLGVFHYFAHHRPRVLNFNPRLSFDYFNPAIILIKKIIWSSKDMVWDESSQDWWFWQLKFYVWALKCVQITLYFTHR